MAGRKHVGIVDEDKAKALKFFDDCARDKQKVTDWLEEQRRSLVVIDADAPVDDKARQRGKALHFTLFEKMIRKLPNGDHYVFNDINPLFKGLCYQSPSGNLIRISAYGKVDVPEFSTVVVKREMVRDFSLSLLKPVDMPEMKWNAETRRHESKDGSLLPGWKWEYKTEGENPFDAHARGYRTILMKIVELKLATPNEVEKVFGRSSRQSWNSLHSKNGWKF